jgi:hypothetical protein
MNTADATDADGDGVPAHLDCDDTDDLRGRGLVEACDGVDNDCNGQLDASPVESETSPGVWSSDAAQILGNSWQMAQPADLIGVTVELDAPAGVRASLGVFEGASPTGPWTRVALQGLPLVGAGPFEFGPFDVEMAVGLTYAAVLQTHDTSRILEAAAGSADPPFGSWQGGPAVSGDLPADGATFGLTGDELWLSLTTSHEFDADGDGWFACLDCDDEDDAVAPSATELCNGVDDDCDGLLSEAELDDDGDGQTGCDGDCDSDDATIWSGAPELCDGLDNDCDGFPTLEEVDLDGDGEAQCDGDCAPFDSTISSLISEFCDGFDSDCDGVIPPEEIDNDGDGRTECEDPDGDCDDTNGATFPTAVEICDGADNNCDGALPLDEQDVDADGFLACDDDCDDGDAAVRPDSPEVCDGVDTDCDGSLLPEELDADGDGSFVCNGDCSDLDPAVFSGADEVCDGKDNDCDEELLSSEVDADGDGFLACDDDCDDTENDVYPGAPEICDSVDSDCDGALGEDEQDLDGDGYAGCSDQDCDDHDPLIHIGAVETCNWIDDDCDGELPPEETDADGDGSAPCDGDCDDTAADVSPFELEACDGRDTDCNPKTDETTDADGDGYSPCDGDCLDDFAPVNPGRPEICDGLDTDCDGAGSDLPEDEFEDFADLDEDGETVCEGDCDDLDPAVLQAAEEACDGVDNNCDGLIDPDCGRQLGDVVEPVGIVVGCSTVEGGSGLLAGLVLLLGVRRRRFVLLLLLLVPVSALAGPADDMAVEASQFHQAWCADAASAEDTQAARALALVAPVLANLSEVYDQDRTVFLLYWRGLLYECTHQDDRASRDLAAFVGAADPTGPFAAMVRDAQRRGRRIQVRGRLGLVPPVPKVLVSLGGGYQAVLSDRGQFSYAALGVGGSFRLIGSLRLEVFGRLGISGAVRHESGVPVDPPQTGLLPLFGIGASIRLGTRVHPVFGLAFQLAGNQSSAHEGPVLPGARVRGGVELPLIGGRLYIVPSVEAGFLADWFSLTGGLDVSIGF